MLTECKGGEIPSCGRNPRESGAELWVVQSPQVGGGRGDGDARSPGEGTGHHAISMEIVGRRWSARADSPLSEVKCDALGSCCTSSHPADKRWKEQANDNQSTKEMLDSCNPCQHITFFYILIYRHAGSSLLLSAAAVSRALSFGAWGTPPGFPCRVWRAVGRRLQRVQRADLVAPRRCMGSSPTRDQTPVLCVGRRILNHWTTGEGQPITFATGGFLRPKC